jgi:uncharacterized protein DUF3105
LGKGYLLEHRRSRCGSYLGFLRSWRASLAAFLLLAALVILCACGSEKAGGGGEASKSEETTGGASTGGKTSGEQALTPAEATVGPNEEGAMPAGGREKDPAQSPPENPPEGVKTFPASTNKNVNESVTYDQDPPTHGDHAPYWQNCGFYSSPIENEAAVHSMDHGVVWITYRPYLPSDQVDLLRGLAQEDYVLVSPYPSLYAPVVASAWRNQLALTGADDPRLQQFIDQFRISETAPRAGNGCSGGVGEPES